MQRRWIICLLGLSFFVIAGCFRGKLYRSLIRYELIGERAVYTLTDERLIALIAQHVPEEESQSIDEIIRTSLQITSGQLRFTFSDNEVDPNRLVRSRQAHCVGYANFFAATCNYLLQQNHLTDWSARACFGYLFLFEQNLHQYFDASFFVDHDFVVIEHKSKKNTLAVDPSLHDYSGIEYVRLAGYRTF